MAEAPLTPARWRAMEEILLAIWDAPPGERDFLLNERCEGDTVLLVELRAMLAAEEAASPSGSGANPVSHLVWRFTPVSNRPTSASSSMTRLPPTPCTESHLTTL